MPTFLRLPRFDTDWRGLDELQRTRFRAAVAALVKDLRAGTGFRPGLPVKRVQGTPDVWEMSFAPNGRATWQYGNEVTPGEAHIVWRRVGTHEVFRRP